MQTTEQEYREAIAFFTSLVQALEARICEQEAETALEEYERYLDQEAC